MKSRLMIFVALLLSGCAVTSPILDSNAHLQRVGQAQARREIWQCMALADQLARPSLAEQRERDAAAGGATGEAVGHVRGVITGHPARVAASLPPQVTPGWMRLVSRCLKERGYEVAGWSVQSMPGMLPGQRVSFAPIQAE